MPSKRGSILDSHNVPDVAHLNTVNFSAIASNDPSETSLLLKSCIEHGFFYLDFRDHATCQIREDVRGIYAFMKDYFRQPIEIKMRDSRGTATYG